MGVSTELGWKVLRKEPGRPRTSIYATTGAVEYRQGRATKPWPNCGPLTLFKTRDAARRFVNTHCLDWTITVPVKYEPYEAPLATRGRGFTLWEPWAEVPERKPLRSFGWRTTKDRKVVDRVEVTTRTSLPTGTILASSITCLE